MIFLPRFPLYWIQDTPEKRHEALKRLLVKRLAKSYADFAWKKYRGSDELKRFRQEKRN